MVQAPERRSQTVKLEHLAQIAVGQTSTVDLCRALDPQLAGRLVAVKRLHPEASEDLGMATRFLDEVWMTASLTHQNVVTVVGWGTDDKGDYLAVELVQGVSLERLMKTVFDTGEQFRERMVVYIGSCLCAGLSAAHELRGGDGEHLNLVHRDLTPGNVLLSFDGDIKIADFGLAKAKQRLTTTTVGLPKRTVIAPEEIQGKVVDRRADLFALGVLLFELLAGQRPWKGNSELENLEKLMKEPPSDLMDLRPKMDRNLAKVILKAIEKDPDNRYQTAAEIRTELNNWLYAHGYQEGNPETLSRFVRRNAMKQMRWFEQAVQGRTSMTNERGPRPQVPSYQSTGANRAKQRAESAAELRSAATAVAAPPRRATRSDGEDSSSGPSASSARPSPVAPSKQSSSGTGPQQPTADDAPPDTPVIEDPDTVWDSPPAVEKWLKEATQRPSAPPGTVAAPLERPRGKKLPSGRPIARPRRERLSGKPRSDAPGPESELARGLPLAPELLDLDSEDDYAPTLAIRKDQLPWHQPEPGASEMGPAKRPAPAAPTAVDATSASTASASTAPEEAPSRRPPPLPARRPGAAVARERTTASSTPAPSTPAPSGPLRHSSLPAPPAAPRPGVPRPHTVRPPTTGQRSDSVRPSTTSRSPSGPPPSGPPPSRPPPSARFDSPSRHVPTEPNVPDPAPSAANVDPSSTHDDLLTDSERLRARAGRRKEEAKEARAAVQIALEAAARAEQLAATAEEAAALAVEAVRLYERGEQTSALEHNKRARVMADGAAKDESGR